ncbi:MAG: alpha/beta fold hydrolase [Candidatus Heimdallarchaeota archaeon]
MPDGARLGYVDEGNGTPLVMMYGWTGTAHRHFDTMIEQLRSDYRVIAPDLRGYGASSPPFRDFQANFLQRDADDVAFLLEALNCNQVTVFGFSDGGESALLLASNQPKLVAGLVVWGTLGVESPVWETFLESLLPVEEWEPDLAEWREAIIANHGVEQLVPMITGRLEAMQATLAAGGDISLSRAHLIACPTLLIYGEKEERDNAKEVAQLASHIPNCRLEIIADCDHFIQKEQPERFMTVVRSFLSQLS